MKVSSLARAHHSDFRQRFGLNDLLSTILTPDQAIELLGVYIGAVTGETAADDPYPFSTGAVHALLSRRRAKRFT